jgi:hypothetical protein
MDSRHKRTQGMSSVGAKHENGAPNPLLLEKLQRKSEDAYLESSLKDFQFKD